jgi:hypothetical protein
MKPKTENPPKLKLPKKIKQRPEEAYPDKWAFDTLTRKIIKLVSKKQEEKLYSKKVIFTEYKEALKHKEQFLISQLEDAKKIVKRYQNILHLFHGDLYLTQEELKRVGSES